MDRLPGYDEWLLEAAQNNVRAMDDIRPPDQESICMNCGQYILDEKGKEIQAWDCNDEYDPEWRQTFWFYWHDNCHKGEVA